MNDERKNQAESRGIGVGYVTLIMLFAVICLTVLASLSYQAARANDKLNEKSISYTDSFYEADTRAKLTLSELDAAASEAHRSCFFYDGFSAYCAENEQLSVKQVSEGFEVSYSEEINESLILSVKIVFFNIPSDGARYRIEEWKTVTASADGAEETLGVWDGGMLG